MKDRSNKQRSYSSELMQIGEPGEAYIKAYLEREFIEVKPIGKEKRRRDYRCISSNGEVQFIEGKTDTKISQTKNIPWEIFRLEQSGMKAYLSWGYATSSKRVIFFVPQWLKLIDIQTGGLRQAIFDYFTAKNDLRVFHTLTDNDRITFFFGIPISILRSFPWYKEVEISEIPLDSDVPYQIRLNGKTALLNSPLDKELDGEFWAEMEHDNT